MGSAQSPTWSMNFRGDLELFLLVKTCRNSSERLSTEDLDTKGGLFRTAYHIGAVKHMLQVTRK